MMNFVKFLPLCLAPMCLLLNAPVYAGLNANTEAVLDNNDPLLVNVLTHVVKENVSSSELQLQCEALLMSNSPYHNQVIRLLKGQSCSQFIAQNVDPIKQDFGQYIQALSSTTEN